MQLLALDLATRLGWAAGSTTNGEPVSGWHQLPKGTKTDLGEFAVPYDVFLRRMIEEHDINMVVFEAPVPMGGKRGATMLATTLKLHGLCYHTELVCKLLKVTCRQCNVGTWKSQICGTSRFNKSHSPYPPVIACAQRGWEVKDDNEADALCIWLHAQSLLSRQYASRFDPINRVGLS